MTKRISSSKLRLLYEEHTLKKVPDNFDVHHLDFDPLNNEISNLLAIPRILHSSYHMNLDRYQGISHGAFHFNPKKDDFYMELPISFLEEDLKKILTAGKIYSEMCDWFNFKSYLLGKYITPTGGCYY